MSDANYVTTVMSVGSAYYFTMLTIRDFSKKAKSGESLKILYNDQLDPSVIESINIIINGIDLTAEIKTDTKPNYIIFTKK
ncbi:hypothetical protein M1494_03405 [Candidatus Parvarchaeota archaeon]|nr:hypothetical protein [Candidatus Parvarchaeota archaeon]